MAKSIKKVRKKGAAETASGVLHAADQPPPHGRPSPDWHHQMVEEAAYFIAEKRGFASGDPVADWLAAEAQIDSQFAPL